MTSKQIMLILSAAWLLGVAVALPGCNQPQRLETTKSPYDTRRVFAVAPLRNESGSGFADGVRLADKITYQLALTRGLDTLPVNRVLAAMEALGMSAITSREDAILLRQALGIDGLVVGSVTAYDPYSPMKLGLNLELYLGGRDQGGNGVNPRQLSRASTDDRAVLPAPGSPETPASPRSSNVGFPAPVTAIAGFYDASDPSVTDLLTAYVVERGRDDSAEMTVRRHHISIDLYSEFVSHQLTSRLMESERLRLRGPRRDQNANRHGWAEPSDPTSRAYGHSPDGFE